MSESTKFSVIIPVYNKLPHIERSIGSVMRQTYKNFELIIVDDASTDGSSDKLKWFNDSRIKLFRRDIPGPGGYAARNLGIENATAEWILFLDADDEWDNKLLEHVNSAISNSSVDMVCWSWFYVKGDSKKLDTFSLKNKHLESKSFSLKDYLNGPRPIWTGAVALKRELLILAGMFPAGKYNRGGDLDTWIRYLMQSKNNLWINKTLSLYHIDSVNMVTKTAVTRLPATFETLKMLYEHTKDTSLKRAINKFQNSTIFAVLNKLVIKDQGIDYNLLSKMRIDSYRPLYYILLLHYRLLKKKVF